MAYWKLDESSGMTAADSSGNGNDGTLLNMAGTEWTTGSVDGALLFDGAPDRVDIGDPAGGELDFGQTTSFTMSAWIKADDVSGPGRQRIISKGQIGWENGGYALWQVGGKIGFGMPGGTQADSLAVETGTAISAGSWYHVASVIDQTAKTVRTYVDGVAQTLTVAPPGFTCGTGGSTTFDYSACTNVDASTSSALNIGGPHIGTEYFDGTIDDVQIYNGALSASEVNDLYNLGSPPPPSPGLVAHWKLDESAGTTAADSAGTNDGTLINSPTWQPTGGRIDGAIDLGTTSTVRVANDSALKPPNDMTVAAWVRFDSVGRAQTIVIKGHTAAPWYSYELLMNASSQLMFQYRKSDGSGGSRGTSAAYSTGTWHHVVGIRRGNDIELYVDGVVPANWTAGLPLSAGTILDSDSVLAIGSDNAPTNVDGRVDDVRIYNKALSPAEVSDLYNAAPPPPPPGKIVFVTSTSYNGDLKTAGGGATGEEGANNICNNLAAAASLPGTYKAWLSYMESGIGPGPADFMNQHSGPYETVTGVVIANDWADLIDDNIQNPINVTEQGTSISSQPVWSGVGSDGFPEGMIGVCMKFENDSAVGSGGFGAFTGLTSSTSMSWTQNTADTSLNCANLRRFYCFEQ